MTHVGTSGESEVAAGDFGPWVKRMQVVIRSHAGSEVPCAGCTACCTSSQFIHIGPEETDTLSRIPPELLFPAPRLPHGHVLLGCDQNGHCPMLINQQCSIYEDRPQTCRTYDCRVFPASGVELRGHEQTRIANQARQWRFSHPDPDELIEHDAVRAAATFLDHHHHLLPEGTAPSNETQLAVLAIRMHDLFLACDEETGQARVVEPDPEVLRHEITRRMG
jgi:Fe-S-cluster containining protein